jgi:hypothetical protein
MKELSKENYDFSCCLIKYDHEIIFLDKLVYDKDSLVDIDYSVVPLCWDHKHNDPEKVIGKVLLEDREDGVYVYGKLFDNAAKFDVRRLIEAKAVYISPYLNQVKIKNHHLTYGKVREVSLVLDRVDPDECYRPVLKGE